MKRKRRTFSKEFKLNLLRELENGKKAAEICRENTIHQTLLYRWKKEYHENPEFAFKGQGNICKENARTEELERLVGKLYAENAFLKKVLSSLEKRMQEQQEKHNRS
jgi:transposase